MEPVYHIYPSRRLVILIFIILACKIFLASRLHKILVVSIRKNHFVFLSFSPPDIPQHLTSSHEFPRLPSLPLHQNDITTKASTNTLTNDDHNGSFEDEDIDDEHSHTVDQPDGQYPPQTNGGTIVKAYALYEFNGKNISSSHNSIYFCFIVQVKVSMVLNM
jgi:hypothetical protein